MDKLVLHDDLYKPGSVFTVEEYSLLGDESVCDSHFLQYICHPVLNPTFCWNMGSKIHHLTLSRNHGSGKSLVVITLLESQ